MLTQIATEQDLESALAHSEEKPVVLFKHSITCPTSARADRQLQRLHEDGEAIYRLVVQHSRALSNRIAETLDIIHQSPQAIIIWKRSPTFHAAHYSVTASALREALGEVRAD